MSELLRPFDAARDHWRGGDGVVILEYGDYECPYARQALRKLRGTPMLFLDGRLHRGRYDHGTLRATLDSPEAT